MKIKHAVHVLDTIQGKVLGVGALWISGYLDEASEASRTVQRYVARKKAAAKKKALKKATKKRSTR